jgi:hypothetical protein
MLNISNFTPLIYPYKSLSFQELVGHYCGQFNGLVVWCVMFLLSHYVISFFVRPVLYAKIDLLPENQQDLFEKGLSGIMGFLNTGSLFIMVYFLVLVYYQNLLKWFHYAFLGFLLLVIVYFVVWYRKVYKVA